jgi:hypothetical protein
MPLVPFTVPPGIVRAGTEYQSRGRWYDASLVRFFAGTVQPVGGWSKQNPSSITGRPCALFGWRPNAGVEARWLAVGTEQKAYAYDGSTVYDITPTGFTTGDATATSDTGYGGGNYGAGTYGTARTGTVGVSPVDAWHFDAWGENLVGCFTADGRLLEWGLNTANDFAVISNAPTSCVGLVVSAERMLFALGAGGDARKVQWSDQEDNTNWTPGTTTTAGDLLLTTDGKIITAERVRGGILVHTDTDAHLVSYVGTPFFYGVERVGDGCGIVSANAKVATASITAWMSFNGFYVFDGYVRPIPCDVHDYVFSNITKSQISKVAAWHNGEWGEIWWFYPANGASENNRYVVWNYREGHWTIGALARTAGIDRGAWPFPICASPGGDWFQHETGYTNDGAERGTSVFLESGPTELVPGERLTWLNQVIHDESDNANRLQLSLLTKFTPEGTETTRGPYQLSAANGYTDVRAQGRAYKVRLEEVSSGAWKLGTLRMDVRAGGKR